MLVSNFQNDHLLRGICLQHQSVDNDPAPLLGLADVTCCPCHVCVCVLECDPHDVGIAVSYCFVLQFFCTQWQICFFSMFVIECFLHPPDETQ